MDSAAVAILGAVASALFGAYFIGSFAFVAYALRKYDDLKDELRRQQAAIHRLDSVQTFFAGYGEKSMGEEGPSHG